MRPLALLSLALLLLLPAGQALAQAGIPLLSVDTDPGGTQTYSVTLQILILMTVMSLLPAALIMLTSFTRIIIVLGILRQGIGTTQTPSNQILIGLALFLTFFIMAPVFQAVNEEAIQPFMAEEISQEDMVRRAWVPLRDFMLEQTRETDIAMFARIAGHDSFESPEDVPFSVLVPSFITSELKTAFQIGFLILIPFLIIDLVVASVLMSMGMMMLSPLIISLPFKIMLFVLVDGWAMIMSTLATSFIV
ncbi:flagellar type III secretion system pore protein FliP [Ectothiorhodospira lacustris]|uniref:flagellar type III secretion system pore protein FliP n=1 Tax=Ectothiorhodospira lacustris TaxID=2899127 RepID=UPI001EE942FE|nr:flagellar type III secretion system pore protein FliP [Ectothiorhodospira lacustris]MCG5499520.1 flagellar type III secretion system pore protein FliP [Ectothiorhodospira lacustris]MCG5511098.1 flagellar type III secretion system pore protein FliP [Ectothiorhodospira lacustris]MCG5522894.1 flagellar type III secretion system pore protein FliP [Ectothiorhodospira lacustris]